MGSPSAPYPVATWSKTSQYDEVVIDYSQDCFDLSFCEQPTVDLSNLPGGVTANVEDGKITLTGNYTGINQFMSTLSIGPGAGNPYDVNVKITASVIDQASGTTLTDFDSFIIPIDYVSSVLNGKLSHFSLL